MSKFQDAVASTVEGTPYTVVGTQKGFDVKLDIVDSKWWGLFNREGLRKAFHWEVKEHPTYFTITDRQSSVNWKAGVLSGGISVENQSGRIWSFTRQAIWALSDSGRIEPVVNYRFNSREGRDLIRMTAQQLGLKERQPLIVNMVNGMLVIAAVSLVVYGFVWLALRISGVM